MFRVEFADFYPKEKAGVFKKSQSTLNNHALFSFVYHSSIGIIVMVFATSQYRFTKTKFMKK